MIADAETVSRQRKESQCVSLDQLDLPTPEFKLVAEECYPFAVVLRLRVLQVVCGIGVLLMGSVASIEEKGGKMEMGLGVPAGIFTVIAAAGCIHTSRGFSGYKEPHCTPRLRFLGPRLTAAIPLTIFWGIAGSLQIALVVVSLKQLIIFQTNSQMTSLAWLILGLAVTCLISVGWIIRIDCTHDPD